MSPYVPIFTLNTYLIIFSLIALLILAIALRKKKAILSVFIIFLIIFVSVVVVKYFFNISKTMKYGLNSVSKNMSLVLEKEYSKIETSQNIAKEDMAVIKELVDFAGNEKTSMWGNFLTATVTRNTIVDEQINEQERTYLILIRDLMREKQGKITAEDLNDFRAENPEIAAIIDKELKDKEAWKQQLSKTAKWLKENHLPIHPSAYDVERISKKSINYMRVNYKLKPQYGSIEVFEFYDKLLKEMGWQDFYIKDKYSERRWSQYRENNNDYESFSAHWIDPDKKYTINLRVRYNLTRSKTKEPEIQEIICSVIPPDAYPKTVKLW